VDIQQAQTLANSIGVIGILLALVLYGVKNRDSLNDRYIRHLEDENKALRDENTRLCADKKE